MKKNVMLSVVGLSLIVLASLGFSGSNTGNDDFVPMEKGKSYDITIISIGRTGKATVIEESKGNWVKVDIKGIGMKYLNLNNVALVSVE